MSTEPRLKVGLCWHMHQPEYRSYVDGRYQLPWVYLHAIKDYIDMAAIIEATPGARAVINFVPILLDQIQDYANQIRAHLRERSPIADPLLAALAATQLPDGAERLALVRACLRANERRIIDRFPAYRRLADLARRIDEDPAELDYYSEQFLIDLLTWYHLAWLGETVRREDGRVRQLMTKSCAYSLDDRWLLLEIIGQIMGSVTERYRRLAESGAIELSVTPYAHPMLPLLLDFEVAREAVPDMSLPEAPSYPGGRERAAWHVQEGIAGFERHFGFRPRGCWPAEGGLSTETVALLAEAGFHWTATGGSVLRNSLARNGDCDNGGAMHRAYRVADGDIACFFRDDGLSDLIGFTYYDWHGDDAVANLVHHLENIAGAHPGDDQLVVSIILDGENAWEAYPENGYHFINGLYQRLVDHPGIELATFSECLDSGLEPVDLAQLVAGSWVYGTFSTWMGDGEKNRGWDLLCQAKEAWDRVMAEGKLDAEQREIALKQLAACEGSDWCWWFGDYNPAGSVGDFERLYRLHLSNLYRFLDLEPPENLRQVISIGGGFAEQGGTMRRGTTEEAVGI